MSEQFQTPKKDHLLSNKAYDVYKYIALILLPAIATLYFGLDAIWHLPKTKEIVGSLTVIDTFLGALLKVATTSYNNSEAKYDGEIVAKTDETGATTYSNVVLPDPAVLDQNKDLLFKVSPQQGPLAG